MQRATSIWRSISKMHSAHARCLPTRQRDRSCSTHPLFLALLPGAAFFVSGGPADAQGKNG